MYRIAYSYVRNRMTAEDLVVDSFLKIFNGANNFRFDNLSSFEAWMRKIVVNESLILLRKQANFHLMPESEAIEIPVDENALDSISSDEIYQLIAYPTAIARFLTFLLLKAIRTKKLPKNSISMKEHQNHS